MSSKSKNEKNKDKASKSPKTDKTEGIWQKVLETAEINDTKWNAKIVMVVPFGTKQDFNYMQTFEKAATEEQRFVIKSITKSETYFMINQMTVDKSKEDNKLLEKAQEHVKNSKGSVPADILSLLIKNKILDFKKENIKIKSQKTILSEGLKQESLFLFEKEEMKKVVKAPLAPLPIPQISKKKSAKVNNSQEQAATVSEKKFNTELRERGEEWIDKVYIEDYPFDGPDLYIIITGFTDPHLPYWLLKYGVPLTAIVQVKIVASLMSTASVFNKKGKRSGFDFDAAIFENFWSELYILKENPDTRDNFEDTCFLVFYPPYNEDKKLRGDADNVYDEVSFLLYDIQDLSRQHSNYLNNMTVYPVKEDVRNKSLYVNYCEINSNIPNECCSSLIILDNILQTIVKAEQDNITPVSLSASKSMTTTIEGEDYEKIIKSVFKCLQEEKRKPSYKKNNLKKQEKEVAIIDYDDKTKIKTFHLDKSNSDNCYSNALKLLSKLPIYNIFLETPPISDIEQAKIDYHLNVLLQSFFRDDVEYSELERLLNIVKCKRMYLKFVKEIEDLEAIEEQSKQLMNRSFQVEALVKSSSIILNNSEPQQSNQVCEVETNIKIPALINEELLELEFAQNDSKTASEYIYFQENSMNITLQAINEASQQYNQFAVNYCKLTDTFLIMFYDVFDKNRIFTKEYSHTLCTPICFEEFFEYVFEEQYDWIKAEEKIYDDINGKGIIKVDSFHHSDQPYDHACLGATDLENELLLEGSLKYEAVYKTISEPTIVSEHTKSEPKSGKKDKGKKSGGDTSAKINASKKSKKANRSVSSFSTTYKTTTTESRSSEAAKPFFGYDISRKRCEIKERESLYFSVDGKTIKTKIVHFLAMDNEFLSLTWRDPLKSVWVSLHKSKGNFMSPLPEVVTIKTKDLMSIVLYKKIVQNEEVVSFKVSWPNGLYIESMFDESVAKISHINQSYLNNTHPQDVYGEKKRVVTKEGNVLIYLHNDQMNILKPDGTVIFINSHSIETKITELPQSSGEVTPKKKSNSAISKVKLKKSKTSMDTGVKGKQKKLPEMTTKSEKREIQTTEVILKDYVWIHASGLKEVYISNAHGTHKETLLLRTATDYSGGEVYSRREDDTSILLNRNGTQIVKFCDGTCIATYYFEYELILEELPEPEIVVETLRESTENLSASSKSNAESAVKQEENFVLVDLIYVIEHKNYATVSVNTHTDEISVNMPSDVSLTIQSDTNYQIKMANQTNIFADKNIVKILNRSCTCNNCEVLPSETVIDFNFSKNPNDVEPNLYAKSQFNQKNAPRKQESQRYAQSKAESVKTDSKQDETPFYNESKMENILEMHDSDGRIIRVDYDGVITTEGEANLEGFGDESELINVLLKDDAIPSTPCWHLRGLHTNPRFFFLKRDFTSSELLPIWAVNEYRKTKLVMPWALENSFKFLKGYRRLISIQYPILVNHSQKWIMETHMIPKPKNLLYFHLREDNERKFYKWFRPYARFEPVLHKHTPNILPAMPQAFVVRNLEKQWIDSHGTLRGVVHLLGALKAYRESLEIHCHCMMDDGYYDLRAEKEKEAALKLQDLAHSMREAVLEQMAAHIRGDNSRQMRVRDEDLVSKVGEVVEMRPSLQKYWQRRAAEDRQQEYFRQIINVGPIPPYYEGLFGGAVWLMLHSLIDEVMDIGDKNAAGALDDKSEITVSVEDDKANDISTTTFDKICL